MQTGSHEFNNGIDSTATNDEMAAAIERALTAGARVALLISERLNPAMDALAQAVNDLTTISKLSWKQLQRLTPAERAEYARLRNLYHGKHRGHDRK